MVKLSKVSIDSQLNYTFDVILGENNFSLRIALALTLLILTRERLSN